MFREVGQECFQGRRKPSHPLPPHRHCAVLRTVPLTAIDGDEEWGSRDGAEHSITLLTNMSELDPKDNNTPAAVVHTGGDNYPEQMFFVLLLSFFS